MPWPTLLSDPHLWTAGAYAVIGVILIVATLHVWWTHPVNRAFLFGPFLTERGVRLVLHATPLLWLFGLFIASCALDHAADSFAMAGLIPWSLVRGFALGEAIISWVTALAMLFLVIRWLWRRMWHRT